MSNFIQTIRYIIAILPTWMVFLIIGAISLILIFAVFKIIKLLLDAIPFV